MTCWLLERYKKIYFSNLKAASIGMRRCQRPYDADKFVRICRLLRVLNALRLMGIPLTFTQLEELSPGQKQFLKNIL